jgi:hypothetical protein
MEMLGRGGMYSAHIRSKRDSAFKQSSCDFLVFVWCAVLSSLLSGLRVVLLKVEAGA